MKKLLIMIVLILPTFLPAQILDPSRPTAITALTGTEWGHLRAQLTMQAFNDFLNYVVALVEIINYVATTLDAARAQVADQATINATIDALQQVIQPYLQGTQLINFLRRWGMSEERIQTIGRTITSGVVSDVPLGGAPVAGSEADMFTQPSMLAGGTLPTYPGGMAPLIPKRERSPSRMIAVAPDKVIPDSFVGGQGRGYPARTMDAFTPP